MHFCIPQLETAPFQLVMLHIWLRRSRGSVVKITLTESGGGIKKPGETIWLTCTVSGFSITTYHMDWIRQLPGKGMEWAGRLTNSGSSYYNPDLQNRITITRGVSKSQVILQLSDLQPEDIAIYYCEADELLRLANEEQGAEEAEKEGGEQCVSEVLVVGFDNGGVPVCEVGATHCVTNDLNPVRYYYDITQEIPNEFHARKVILENMLTKFYQHILSLSFAVKEINENPKILPNVTLGFHIYDSYKNAQMTYRSTLDLLFKFHHLVPNYKCDPNKNLLTYSSFPPMWNEKTQFPSYRMVPNEGHQYEGMVSLLKHFGWVWVGFLVVDNDEGDQFLQAVEPLLSKKGICSDFIKRTAPKSTIIGTNRLKVEAHEMAALINRKSKVLVIYGNIITFMEVRYFINNIKGPEYEQNTLVGKVWILSAQIDFALFSFSSQADFQLFHGAIFFKIHSREPPGFWRLLQNLRPDWTQADNFLKEFWEQAFDCSVQDLHLPYTIVGSCTGKERLEDLPGPVFEMSMSGHSYSIYNAVYALAHALHAMFSSHSNPRRAHRRKNHDLQPWQ
ncbi:hypothetical protein EYD10_18255, partial [Varanus komodoensis]